MTTPLRVLCSLCWAVVGTYLVSWFILGTPNLLQLPWAGKVYILVVGGIAWACIDKVWKDMRWDDQLNYGDRKSKQSEKLKPVEDTVVSSWETNSSHSLPPHLQAAVIAAAEEITKVARMPREEWEASMRGFSQAPPKPAPILRGGGAGYQPIDGGGGAGYQPSPAPNSSRANPHKKPRPPKER